MRRLLLALLVFGGLITKLPIAEAAGSVTNCATYGPGPGTLASAIGAGGVITFSCSGTIIVPEIVITTDTTLDASGQTVVLSGNNSNRILTIEQATVEIIHLSIMNGSYTSSTTSYASAGIYNKGGHLSISDSVIAQNALITLNRYLGMGGGLTNHGGTVVIAGSQFYGNSTLNGEGGAIENYYGTMTISNSTVTNNHATSNNTGGGYGGGLANWAGQMTLDNVTVSNNTARSGGGIENLYTQMTINNSTIAQNSVIGGGGGIENFGTLILNNSLIDSNSAIFLGGGIQTGGNPKGLIVTDSRFTNNSVTGTNSQTLEGYGGAIASLGTIDVTTSTFSGNSATVGGNAVWAYSYGTRVVCNSIVGNGGAALNTVEIYQGEAFLGDVRNNWWGDSSGPSGAGPGTGDSVNGMADYSGFLAGPPTSADCPPPRIVPTPPPAASVQNDVSATLSLCTNLDGGFNPVVRIRLFPGAYDIHCRMIAENRHFVQSPAEIGAQSVLDSDVIHAVDVFSPSNANGVGTEMCLQGKGRIVFLDARGAPRIPQFLETTTQGSYTCATLPGLGTVVLVGDTTTASPPVVTHVLQDCFITTTHQVNLRSEPNLNGAVITVLPYQLTLKATERTNGFIKVIYLDGQAWVSADFVQVQGDCGF